jgi:lipoate---protein ligase
MAMHLLNLTLPSPAENLACDEALLDLCEEHGIETLRFWESPMPFVVVGYGNSVSREVNVTACERRGVPILRRCSGGGTVVQGPGCLSYNLTLRIPPTGPLVTVTGTNEFVMERNRAALETLLGGPVSVQGHTDLAFANAGKWLKFSGNAQRRRRRSLVFHGTILYAFDLPLIATLLNFPSAQPEYRASRGHLEFVRNVPADAAKIREALAAAWGAREPAPGLDYGCLNRLVTDQYGRAEWNLRRP